MVIVRSHWYLLKHEKDKKNTIDFHCCKDICLVHLSHTDNCNTHSTPVTVVRYYRFVFIIAHSNIKLSIGFYWQTTIQARKRKYAAFYNRTTL